MTCSLMRIRRLKARVGLVLALSSFAGVPLSAAPGWDDGIAAFRSGDYERARVEFEAVTHSHPKWDGGYFMLGQALMKLGDPAAAARPLAKACELKPKQVGYKMALAAAYAAAGDLDKTATLLEDMDRSEVVRAGLSEVYESLHAAVESSKHPDADLFTDAYKEVEYTDGPFGLVLGQSKGQLGGVNK
jgi:predicted Zn-dependent protease